MNWFDRFLDWILKVYGIPSAEARPRPGSAPAVLGPDFVPPPGHDPGYWVFTKEFDEECNATELAERLPLLTASSRANLDSQWATLTDLKSPLLAQAYELAKEFIASDMSPKPSTVVSLLIDHSGSMRDQMSKVAAAINLAVQSLLAAGIRTEVLGFTTRHWKGGASWAKWRASSAPNAPGRLCDLRHIVYCTADETDPGIAENLKLMLRQEVLRENVDGEALQWAVSRLQKIGASRKLLVVLSDGAPTDESTEACNRPAFLGDHLRFVVKTIQSSPDVSIASIGIGHDTSRFYSNATLVDDAAQLPVTLVDLLARWLMSAPVKTVH